jgi:hypothetical protein
LLTRMHHSPYFCDIFIGENDDFAYGMCLGSQFLINVFKKYSSVC